MTIVEKYKIPLIAITFIWVGFICSISFMEAWLKFRAPLVTLPVGLSIGRLVFFAMNKVEWAFAIAMSLIAIYHQGIKPKQQVFLYIPIAILISQTFIMLPLLYERAEMIIQNIKPPATLVHFYYILLEVIKLFSLFVFGIKSFKRKNWTPQRT